MKKHLLFCILAAVSLLIGLPTDAQVGINATNSQPEPSAGLDVNFTNKGFLPPRLTQAQIGAISNPANGLQVFCTSDSKIYIYLSASGHWKEVAYGSGIIVPVTAPSVTTTAMTNIAQVTATSGGNVISDGGATVTEKGVCWNTSSNPTIANPKTVDGSGTGTFTSAITGLTANTPYYLRSYATNSAGTSYGNEVTFTTLSLPYIGQSYQGGIIFYIDATGYHGLIAATSDQATVATWANYGYYISGTSTAFGTGQANTTAIVSQCGTGGIAARVCDDLVLNGYSDWFLPSLNELDELYHKRTEVGGFTTDAGYWSSSAISSTDAWRCTFDIWNTINGGNVGGPGYVRAIRAF